MRINQNVPHDLGRDVVELTTQTLQRMGPDPVDRALGQLGQFGLEVGDATLEDQPTLEELGVGVHELVRGPRRLRLGARGRFMPHAGVANAAVPHDSRSCLCVHRHSPSLCPAAAVGHTKDRRLELSAGEQDESFCLRTRAPLRPSADRPMRW